MNGDVEFTITDKSIADNSFINLQISNKTTSNYYLPIITKLKVKKWKYELSSEEDRFFFIYKVGYNVTNDKRNWFSVDCNYDVIDTESDKLNELWKKRKKIPPQKILFY